MSRKAFHRVTHVLNRTVVVLDANSDASRVLSSAAAWPPPAGDARPDIGSTSVLWAMLMFRRLDPRQQASMDDSLESKVNQDVPVSVALAGLAKALESAIQEAPKETRRRLKHMLRSVYVQPMVSVLSMKSGADGLTRTALWFRGVLDASAGEARKGILLSIGDSGAIAVSSAGRSTGSWPLRDVFLDDASPYVSHPSSGTPRALVHQLAEALAARIVEAGAVLFQSPSAVPAIVRNWAEHQARTAIAKWAEQLDDDSLDRARALEGPTLPNGTSIYNHLVRRLDENASPDASVFRNRGQFLASKSFLAEATLQDGFRGRGSADYREIARAVDQGVSLRHTLSSLWNASPRTQAWLLSPREEWSGLFVQIAPARGAPQQATLPPEDVPQIVAALEELPAEVVSLGVV